MSYLTEIPDDNLNVNFSFMKFKNTTMIFLSKTENINPIESSVLNYSQLKFSKGTSSLNHLSLSKKYQLSKQSLQDEKYLVRVHCVEGSQFLNITME